MLLLHSGGATCYMFIELAQAEGLEETGLPESAYVVPGAPGSQDHMAESNH